MTNSFGMMRINAPRGQKVTCKESQKTLWGGGEADGKLEIGKVYTVAKTEIFKDSSLVILEEIPGGRYNTVLFEEVCEILEPTQSEREIYEEGLRERGVRFGHVRRGSE